MHDSFLFAWAKSSCICTCLYFFPVHVPVGTFYTKHVFLHVVPVPNRPTTPLTAGTLVPPPRPSSRPKLPAGKLTGINEIVSINYLCNTTLMTLIRMKFWYCDTILFHWLPLTQARPFSPPKMSASPPPTAPLARAESSSSLSSNASLSAANTPTVGKRPEPLRL